MAPSVPTPAGFADLTPDSLDGLRASRNPTFSTKPAGASPIRAADVQPTAEWDKLPPRSTRSKLLERSFSKHHSDTFPCISCKPQLFGPSFKRNQLQYFTASYQLTCCAGCSSVGLMTSDMPSHFAAFSETATLSSLTNFSNWPRVNSQFATQYSSSVFQFCNLVTNC